MSDFVWVDVPNDPGQPLVNGVDEPLNFQALADVDRIIVDEGQGDEVCAYRSGAFRGRYAALSTIDGSRNIELMRQGGWPKAPKVIAKTVELPTPIPTNGQPWGSIYEVDLSALANQTIAAVGSHVIDGKTWWLKGAILSGQTFGVVTGSGLKSFSNANSTLTLPTGVATVGFALYFMPFNQLPNFNPLAPVAVQCRIAEGLPSGTTVRPFCGLVSAAEDSAAWNTRASQMLYGWGFAGGPPGTNAVVFWGGSSTTWTQGTAGATIAQPLTSYCLTILRPAPRLGVAGLDAFVTSYPDPTGALSGMGGLFADAPTNPGLIFSTSAPSSQSAQSYLRGFRVLQPKVP